MHNGNRAFVERYFRNDVAEIQADPFARWIGLGDYAEFIGYTDKRFDPDSVPEKVKVRDSGKLGSVLMDQVYDMVEPIKGKILGVLRGNHEAKYENLKDQHGLTAAFAERLGAPYWGYETHFYLTFIHKPKSTPSTVTRFLVRLHHGYGAAATPAGKLNALIRLYNSCPEADLSIMAHVHEPMYRPNTYIRLNHDGSKRVEHRNLSVITGSYLKTYVDDVDYDTYGAQRGYAPVELGASVIEIIPYHRIIRPTARCGYLMGTPSGDAGGESEEHRPCREEEHHRGGNKRPEAAFFHHRLRCSCRGRREAPW